MSKVFESQVAYSTPFDNTSNGFTSEDVQSAIEEAQTTATGLIQYVITILHNGTVGNVWLGKSEVLPNTPSYVANRNVRLTGISWSNTNASADFDLVFYKNTRTGSSFRTYSTTNNKTGYETGWTDDFSAGDYLEIESIDQGGNASDLGLDLHFTVLG